jgi:thiol-disulfide isomerase/thioredoxin
MLASDRHVPAVVIGLLIAGGCGARTAPQEMAAPAAPGTVVAMQCPADFPTPQQTIAWRSRANAARSIKDPSERARAQAALVQESLDGLGIEVRIAGTSSPTQIATEDYEPVPAVNFDVNLNDKRSFQFTPETATRSLANNGGYYFTNNRVPYLVLGPRSIDARGPIFIREFAQHEIYHAEHHVGDARPLAERELETWTHIFVNYFHRKYPYRSAWEPMLVYYAQSSPAAQQAAMDKVMGYYADPAAAGAAPECADQVKAEFRSWVEQRLKDSRTANMTFVTDLQQKLGLPAVASSTPAYISNWVGSGDVTGDGIAEVMRWNSATKNLVIYDHSSGTPKAIATQRFEYAPNALHVADLDDDGSNELILGEGSGNYNPKEGEQIDIRVNIYKPLAGDDWSPVEAFRAETERPDFRALEIADIDGDGRPEMVFAYYASKYFVEYMAARPDAVGGWEVEKLSLIRMGSAMAIGDALNNGRSTIVVGRPYGDETAEDRLQGRPPLGDAFVLVDGERIPLPVHRGVSSVAFGDVDGDDRPEIVVGDGWHSDYGKVARARLALLRRTRDSWAYELIEDVPEQMRINNIVLADLDGDGSDEIIAQGENRTPFTKAPVYIYRRVNDAWRRTTAADSAQAFAVADVDGDGRPEILLADTVLAATSIDIAAANWASRLAPAVETFINDPKELIGTPAAELVADEWVGGEPVTLASLRGKVVLLDYWATWCAPCISAFPELKRLQADYGPDGFVIIGVTNHSQQASADVRKMVADQTLSWPTAIDPGSRTHMNFGVQNLPHQIIIDQNGTIHSYYVGAGETIHEMERDIRALLRK